MTVPPGAFVKLYATILDSSLWLEAEGTRLLWITMLAVADPQGYVRASVAGLARRANISREACEEGLRVLASPDPDSRTEEHEGRRIEEVAPGTWLVLNLRAYREMRTPKQVADADRQRRHRQSDRVTERDTSHVSQPVTPRSLSISQSGSKEEKGTEEEPRAREAEPADEARGTSDEPDPIAMIERRFGEHAGPVLGLVRAARHPASVAATIAAHLDGLHGPAYTPEVVALGVTEWLAAGEEKFNARHFSGFVKRAQYTFDKKLTRTAARQEEKFISGEDVEAERARREEAEVNELLADFERAHGDEYLTLQVQADKLVDPKVRGMFRQPMIKAALVKLIRERGNR